ncbi:MAG: hypothetical protein WC795_02355 [Candidatus Paceibacterota bacterium]|jgi:hypothetical protein
MKLVINKNEPIILQLEKFSDKNVMLTALGNLKEADDIQKFFKEICEEYKKEDREHPDIREVVRADLAYFSGHSPSWENFKKVLGKEFDEAIKNVQEFKKRKRAERLSER